MNELTYNGTYEDLKTALRVELNEIANGFVRTGYLLKVARDTGIIHQGGYSTVAEFAKAEYNLSKDAVSRFIDINDKYAEGGYSDQLQEKYRGFGVAKLQEMMTLPEPVADLITPDTTRRQIQEIKHEIQEESKITDIERMMEPQESIWNTMLEKAIDVYFHEHREDFVKFTESHNEKSAVDGVFSTFAPSGVANIFVRVPGTGKIILNFQGEDKPITVMSLVTNEKEEYGAWDFVDKIRGMYQGSTGRSGWEAFYGEMYEKIEEVAPVQPIPEPIMPEPVVPESVAEVTTEELPQAAVPETVEKTECEEQLPGQMDVTQFPEYMPDDSLSEENGEVTEKKCTESEENVQKTNENAQDSEKTVSVDMEGNISIAPEDKVKQGYMAAVTNNLHTLEKLWQNRKLDLMLDVIGDLEWRLKKILEMEDTE